MIGAPIPATGDARREDATERRQPFKPHPISDVLDRIRTWKTNERIRGDQDRLQRYVEAQVEDRKDAIAWYRDEEKDPGRVAQYQREIDQIIEVGQVAVHGETVGTAWELPSESNDAESDDDDSEGV